MIKFNFIRVKGFRCYGNDAQELMLSPNVSVVWGANSQGKSSLAEAIEFLLTGQISRRGVISSSRDEFADSLRNAFILDVDEVYIEAEIVNLNDGKPVLIKRILNQDYGKKSDCSTTLEVDGKSATEDDLIALGLPVFIMPMPTSVLMQHAMGYLFSAKPQDRSYYFKALLEVVDLEEFRDIVSRSFRELGVYDSDILRKLMRISQLNPFNNHFNSTKLDNLCNETFLLVKINSVIDELIIQHSDTANFDMSVEEKLLNLVKIFDNLKSDIFPLSYLKINQESSYDFVFSDGWDKFKAYNIKSKTVPEERAKLIPLFEELLKIDEVGNAEEDIDCPVCEDEKSLTLDRMETIKQQISELLDFVRLRDDAVDEKNALYSAINSLGKYVSGCVPVFANIKSVKRKSDGFTLVKIRELLPNDDKLINEWIHSYSGHMKLRYKIQKKILIIKGQLNLLAKDVSEDEVNNTKRLCNEIFELYEKLKAAEVGHVRYTLDLHDKLTTAVSKKTNTEGWADFIYLAQHVGLLLGDLKEFKNHKEKLKAIESSIKNIDSAIEDVFAEKFDQMSEEIKYWWDALRPDEHTYFKAVQQRPKAKRTIDFKAGMSTGRSGSDVVRDVVAVFSQSQINCLGLASFLARSVSSLIGFVVLDDPILSVDEDHREHFTHDVIEKLIERGFQVIVLTQDQKTWNAILDLYAYKDAAAFNVVLENHVDGSKITKTGDSLSAQLSRIETYVKSNHPDIRKTGAEKLRDAAERFCKELLVLDKRSKGQRDNVTNYHGNTLERLSDLVLPILNDTSHSGKLKNIRKILNPGKHDDDIPSKSSLVVAFGDLRAFDKHYLR